MSIIAISNQKGGVAKTTTTANLGYILAEQGKRVLLVDLDPQANLTSTSTTEKAEMTITEVLRSMIEDDKLPEPSKFISKAGEADIICSSIGLAAMETALTGEMGAQHLLKELLAPICDRYDYILVDTPPSLGVLLVNALTAAHKVLIPAIPEYYNVSGIQDLFGSIRKVRRRLNPQLMLAGVVFTMVQNNTNTHNDVMQQLRKSAEGNYRIFHTVIPRAIDTTDALWYGSGIVEVDPNHKVSVAYYELAKVLLSHGI